jgi:hypothetical protein
MEAAGVARASRETEVVLQHVRCAERGSQQLHDVYMDMAIREPVVNWQLLTPLVTAIIVKRAGSG